MTVDYSFRLCPDCSGQGLTINPEAPMYRDQTCATCRGVGFIDNERHALRGADFWGALAVMVACLPVAFGRDLLHFGWHYAWLMARVHWGELRDCWKNSGTGLPVDANEVPEASAAWFARAKLRQPSEPE